MGFLKQGCGVASGAGTGCRGACMQQQHHGCGALLADVEPATLSAGAWVFRCKMNEGSDVPNKSCSWHGHSSSQKVSLYW
jgi:hypothetical protein